MDSLNQCIQEYRKQLRIGDIQKAYKGIISFMLGLRTELENKYPEHLKSSVYYGYMDMTYFAFTPAELRNMGLKIAIVYLHEKGTFEAWLAADNRKIQADYIKVLKNKEVGEYKISEVFPRVDSIVESVLAAWPDFDAPAELKMQIEIAAMSFTNDMISLLQEDRSKKSNSCK